MQDIHRKPSPKFDNKKVIVVFVLGGPGSGMLFKLIATLGNGNLFACSGKGTQCALLVKDFDFCHLSGE